MRKKCTASCISLNKGIQDAVHLTQLVPAINTIVLLIKHQKA